MKQELLGPRSTPLELVQLGAVAGLPGAMCVHLRVQKSGEDEDPLSVPGVPDLPRIGAVH